MEEVFKIADRASVMRDGKMIETFDIKDITVDQLVSTMVGRKMDALYPKIETKIGERTLEIKNYSVPHALYETNIVENANM